MRSPRDMQIIQIELTNACVHQCSNCTRFCGHHRNNFFMDWTTFKRAVDSLKDFKGTIGIMGGEPTLHPEFDRFVRYLHAQIRYKKGEHDFARPTDNFIKKIHLMQIANRRVHENAYGKEKNAVYGAGLWSALVPTYYEHFELIQDVFKIQILNDHSHVMYHSPILFSRKDVGIRDEEWPAIRDKCWAQEHWSASITPKGAFFCEIAAALDMLFDGEGGIPIEPGWWMKEPEDFHQYHWCELCGIALAPYTRNANDEVDDISPEMFEKLKKIKSPKVASGKYHIMHFDTEGHAIVDDNRLMEIREEQYWDDFSDRLDKNNTVIMPKGFDGVVFLREANMQQILANVKQLDKLVVVAEKERYRKVSEQAKDNSQIVVINGTGLSFGQKMNRALQYIDDSHFVVYYDEDIIFSEMMLPRLRKFVLNPGTLHFSILNGEQNLFVSNALSLHGAVMALFSKRASSLKEIGFDRIAAAQKFSDIAEIWPEEKIIPLLDTVFRECEAEFETGQKYVVYGIGPTERRVTEELRKVHAVIVAYCDSSATKWGKEHNGIRIVPPSELPKLKRDGAKIVVASNYYAEIRREIEKQNIDWSRCIVVAV